MKTHLTAGWRLLSLSTIFLLAACAPGSGPSPPASSIATNTPTMPVATPLPTTTFTTPAPTPSATPIADEVARDVPYETSNPLGRVEKLDVYAPSAPGSWPVVVMFHGQPLDKGYLARWAVLVAAEGFVVFVPNWGKISLEAEVAMARHDELLAMDRQTACAVAFARAHAPEYGGDPSTMILFGHSAGASHAAYLAFARPQPTDGCPGGDALGPISALVTFEGDWLNMDPMHDSVIADDPTMLAAIAPWEHLAEHPDLPVVMLVSEGEGGVVELPALDPPVDWLKERDSLVLRQRFLAAGVRADIAQQQAMLYAALKAQGNPASLTALRDSDHTTIGLAGQSTFLAAFHVASGE